MDYGFAIDGDVGMDFLLQVGAVIDLSRLEVYQVSCSVLYMAEPKHAIARQNGLTMLQEHDSRVNT